MRKNKLKLNLLLWISVGIMLLSGCQKDNSNENITLGQDEYIVSEELACSIAGNITIPQKDEPLKFSSSNLKSLQSKKVKEIHTVPNDGKGNVCYVINYEGGGFIVLSADKRLMPVLAFSDSSELLLDSAFTPGGVVAWMYNVKERIDQVHKNNQKPDKKIEKEWNYLVSAKNVPPDDGCKGEFEQVGPLLTTLWHQGCGFNSLLKTESEIGCTNLPCDMLVVFLLQWLK